MEKTNGKQEEVQNAIEELKDNFFVLGFSLSEYEDKHIELALRNKELALSTCLLTRGNVIETIAFLNSLKSVSCCKCDTGTTFSEVCDVCKEKRIAVRIAEFTENNGRSTDFEDEVTCPWCGNKETKSWEYDDDDDCITCNVCWNDFAMTRYVEVTYSTIRIGDSEK
jgi:hypothetical protein